MRAPTTQRRNFSEMAKKDYKETFLAGTLTYFVWRAMFVAKQKSEKLQKYIENSAILLSSESQHITYKSMITNFNPNTGTAKSENDSDYLVNKTALEVQLGKKETYKVGFEQVKKKYFMSVNKIHLVTILELSNPRDMFDTLD